MYMKMIKWESSLLSRMGYVKRKYSTSGEVTASHFEEVKKAFLTSIARSCNV